MPFRIRPKIFAVSCLSDVVADDSNALHEVLFSASAERRAGATGIITRCREIGSPSSDLWYCTNIQLI